MVNTSYLDVGVLRDILLPNLGVQVSVALPAYLIGRRLDRFEAKDWVWGGGQVVSAWYAAIGRHVVAGIPLSTAVKSVTRPGWLLLAGVTAWGGRLLYRVATRTLKRGHDDPRYDELKKDPQGWNKALFALFGLEALVQSVVTLPFTAPFRVRLPALVPPANSRGLIHGLAVALFATGFALEVLADAQLAAHQEEGKSGLLREGVWSIVRHPNYLGDILIHSSWPLLLYANGLFNPITLFGPIANWFFLRHYGGDKENEASQAERYETTDPEKKAQFDTYRAGKNAVWPSVSELRNQWTWIAVAIGAGAALVERSIANLL